MKTLEIDPQDVRPDHQGYEGTRWRVRLPEGARPDDLRDPALWARVQKGRKPSLRRFDEVLCIAHDESFAVLGLIVEARQDAAVFAFIKIIDLSARLNTMFNNGTHKVIWSGACFMVERIADGSLLPGNYASEDSAIASITSLRGAA